MALTDERPGVSVIEEKTLLDKARNDWRVCETPLSEWLLEGLGTDDPAPSRRFRELWKERNERGKPIRILVVVNTVQKCQSVAKALRQFKPICYHSKFIFKDRVEKEAKINKCRPRLLIATQVVEVSLDIDYDVLLTECAALRRIGAASRESESRPPPQIRPCNRPSPRRKK